MKTLSKNEKIAVSIATVAFFVVMVSSVFNATDFFVDEKQQLKIESAKKMLLVEHQNNMLDELNKTEGLTVEKTKEGEGDVIAVENASVSVHYVGTFDDGTIFDSSYLRGDPLSFTIGSGNMIQGFDLGVRGMKIGEKRDVAIAPELAYGTDPEAHQLANQTLHFEILLVDAEAPAESGATTNN